MLKRVGLACATLLLSAALAQAFWNSRDSNYNLSIAASPSGGLVTPVLSIFPLATSLGFPVFGGIAGTDLSNTTAQNSPAIRRVPVPLAGTITALAAAFPVTQPAGTSIALNLGATAGVFGNTTCTYATSSPFNCAYSGIGDHLAAGALIQWQVTLGSGTWNATGGPAQASFLFTADSGQNGPLFSAAGSTAAPTGGTPIYESVGMPSVSTAEVIVSSLQPAAGAIAALYVYPNGSDNGANIHTYTLFKNGSATALACSGDPSNPTLGCCINVGGTGNIGGNALAPCSNGSAISVAVNDTLSIQMSCGGTCAAVNPGMSVLWQPSTPGQVPLFNATNTPSPTVQWFSSAIDSQYSTITNVNWNIAPNLPSTMTIGSLLACTSSTITTGTWTAQLQYSTSLIAPATTTGAPVATYGSGSTCPGSGVGGVMHSGAQDLAHSLVVSPNYTLGFNIIPTSTPTVNSRWKTGMVVTVP